MQQLPPSPDEIARDAARHAAAVTGAAAVRSDESVPPQSVPPEGHAASERDNRAGSAGQRQLLGASGAGAEPRREHSDGAGTRSERIQLSSRVLGAATSGNGAPWFARLIRPLDIDDQRQLEPASVG